MLGFVEMLSTEINITFLFVTSLQHYWAIVNHMVFFLIVICQRMKALIQTNMASLSHSRAYAVQPFIRILI